MSETFPHDSFFGGLNLLKRRDNRFFILAGERPPYPIINDNPTTLDVIKNLNTADIGIFCAFALIGKLRNTNMTYRFPWCPLCNQSSCS
jgi:hypothetical protein